MQPTQDSSQQGAEGGGRGGLVNMGNTCYANATMQALRHCSRVPWLLEDGRYTTLLRNGAAGTSEQRQKQESVARAFAEVVQMLGQCKRGQSVRPGQFWKATHAAVDDTCFEQFRMKVPHDSHEFYVYLLDTLHEATAQEVEMRILRPPPVTVADHHAIQALERWRREFSKTYSPFVDLFYGLLHSQIRCTACGHVSHSWESFNSLKAAVPARARGEEAAPPGLAEMLEAEWKAETIEGYACDKCAPTRTTAEKRVQIWRLPQVVTVVLKRFTPDGRKIHTAVAAPPVVGMDLKPFFSAESPEKEGVTVYDLRAVVDHHGGGAGGGHYTAQCKGIEDAKWYFYDDEGVGEMPGPQFGESTYMLFFERRAAGEVGPAAAAPAAALDKAPAA